MQHIDGTDCAVELELQDFEKFSGWMWVREAFGYLLVAAFLVALSFL
jgi:hypothetical protein